MWDLLYTNIDSQMILSPNLEMGGFFIQNFLAQSTAPYEKKKTVKQYVRPQLHTWCESETFWSWSTAWRDHVIIPYNGPPYGKQISANQESYNVTLRSLTVIADAAWQARAVPQRSSTPTPKQIADTSSLLWTVNLVYYNNSTAVRPHVHRSVASCHTQTTMIQVSSSGPSEASVVFYKCQYHKAGLTKPFMMDTKSSSGC